MTEKEAIAILSVSEEMKNEIPFLAPAYDVAIKALEEIQRYRAIENELKEKYHANVNIPLLMRHFIETIFEGEKHEGFCILTNEDAKMWEDYQSIGTVEELQALKEKSVAKNGKKPIVLKNSHRCPTCNAIVGITCDFCFDCGQLLDWE